MYEVTIHCFSILTICKTGRKLWDSRGIQLTHIEYVAPD